MVDSNDTSTRITSPRHLGSALGISAILPAAGTALLPAATCPACWPAYAGLLSSLGVGFIDYTPWQLPLTVVFLIVALAILAWQGRKRHAWGPLLLGVTGSILLLVGKFLLDSELALYGGVAALVTASVWNAWPRRTCGARDQPGA